MLISALGVAWLVFAPLALWFLVRGRTLARVAAVLALGSLEAATVVLTSARQAPATLARPPAGDSAASPTCVERRPRPTRATTDADRLTLSWPAETDECAWAEVLLRRNGRRLRVWVHQGGSRHDSAVLVPVTVTGGVASLRVPVESAGRGRLLPVDSRTGRRIPRHAPADPR